MDPARISLRPFMLSDVDDFSSWASDDRVTQYLRWNTITSKEEALKYLQEVTIPHPWRRSICLDDHSIGYISVMHSCPILATTGAVHISVCDQCRVLGTGIVTRALKLALSKVFDDLTYLVRLQAVVETENIASQRVLEKVGFQKEVRKYGYNKGIPAWLGTCLWIASCLLMQILD